jgi:isopenicillin-N N-acyltransferase like protein
MNREGVSIIVNGAPSDLPADGAEPTCLVAREVLEHAHHLTEAVDIIRQRRTFVSAMFLVGSRKDGRFVVVEKTPLKTAVLEPEDGADFLICANHYLTLEFKDTSVNEVYKRADTSVSRFDRLAELLRHTTNRLDAASCVALLRDRLLPGGQLAGDGHRGSLNPLISTHSVVMDLEAGIFWAAVPPHQLGKFVAFDINDPERPLPTMAVPADPILTGGQYERYLTAKDALTKGWSSLKAGDLGAATGFAHMAETNNPGFYQNSWLLAEVLFRQGNLDGATRCCDRALAGKPALGGERQQIERLQAKARKPK